MATYICNIVVLSNCAFENTPIIYEYVQMHSSSTTYIETTNFIVRYENDDVKVELKQIATCPQMSQFIKENIKKADLVVIYESESTTRIPESILNSVENKPKLFLNSKFDYKTSINNEIYKLFKQYSFQQESTTVSNETRIDDKIQTIFGTTKNQRLIAIDKCLDRWFFCCV